MQKRLPPSARLLAWARQLTQPQVLHDHAPSCHIAHLAPYFCTIPHPRLPTLHTYLQLILGRAEAIERHLQTVTLRAQVNSKKVLARKQREALWKAENEQRDRRERGRESRVASRMAWQEEWLAGIQQREQAAVRAQESAALQKAEVAAAAAVRDEEAARRVALQLVALFDTNCDQRLDRAEVRPAGPEPSRATVDVL